MFMTIGYAKTDAELAGTVMLKATEQKARYESLITIQEQKDSRIEMQALEIFIDKILIVVLACVKISL
jgi:hypothetical protein